MPSNYTIAKGLQRIAYYREICGRDTGKFLGTMLEAQALKGVRLDEIVPRDPVAARALLNEADDEAWLAVQQLVRGDTPTALAEDKVPLTILEITEVKGIGGKMARRAYEELGVTDLQSLKKAADDGRLSKVKGFGPKMIE